MGKIRDYLRVGNRPVLARTQTPPRVATAPDNGIKVTDQTALPVLHQPLNPATIVRAMPETETNQPIVPSGSVAVAVSSRVSDTAQAHLLLAKRVDGGDLNTAFKIKPGRFKDIDKALWVSGGVFSFSSISTVIIARVLADIGLISLISPAYCFLIALCITAGVVHKHLFILPDNKGIHKLMKQLGFNSKKVVDLMKGLSQQEQELLVENIIFQYSTKNPEFVKELLDEIERGKNETLKNLLPG